MSKQPTAGYSGTPLAQKLGIKPDQRVALLNAPPGFGPTLGDLPQGVNLVNSLRGAEPCAVILFFTKSRAELEKHFISLKSTLAPSGGLWIAWPKKASGVATDLTEDVIREIALVGGLVDNKVCAVDAIWSGLRLVFRLADRPAKSKAK